jgi:prepilin peptidase CpaA
VAGLHILVLLAFAAVLVWAAVGDMRRRLIPNWVSLAAVAMYPLFAATSHTPPDWPAAIAVAAALLAAGFGLFAANLLGGGDAKLMSAVALWAGQGLILTFLFVMTIAGGLLAIVVLLRQRLAAAVGKGGEAAAAGERATGLPYGVAIAIGGLTVAANLYSGM